ncbi:MAG: alpha/beta hydrolase, partial [Gammaproteobacteria bacterium]|nr:alpha/beta hydrolase [Gammaproteobacteria bacterium]
MDIFSRPNVTYLLPSAISAMPISAIIYSHNKGGQNRMEKIEQAPGNSSFGNLFTRIAKKKSSLINKIAPRWTNSRIDAMLFVPKAKDAKPLRLPRGFVESEINTNDGAIKVYQTGRGPTVVFVHGWGGGAPQFFPLMRGLAQCGFTALAFDHLGHGQSEQKPATL